MVAEISQDNKEKWMQMKENASDEEVRELIEGLLVELERLAGENKRLKTALLKAATAQKPSMSTKLSDALRE
ncbi:Ni2+-binding GTPase [Paenibacillus puerhi]|uniref:Ni2+-binding GTPase n=1 Tax=Paenibacillus puerhi TaxID=2692622 RepID=UPI00135C2161|nr:Ni2+-binding GTPase [Paenibacillus puerhi]